MTPPTAPQNAHRGGAQTKSPQGPAPGSATSKAAQKVPSGWGERLLAQLPQGWRINAELSLFGLTQVPMIFYCRPKIARIDDDACWVDMPLGRRTRNHFRSMYFGALAVGADVAGGFLARHHILKSHHRLSLIFKSFSADFLKRPQAWVRTACEDGPALAAIVQQANDTGERVTCQVALTAVCPSIDPEAVVARFGLEVSVKKSSKVGGTGEH